MYTIGYLNGKFITTDKPHLFLDDIGLLRGFASFDFLRIYNKKPFELKAHYLRFLASSKMLGLRVPVSYKELERVLMVLVKKNKVSDAHVRLVLTGGKTVDSLLPSTPNFFILFEKFNDLPKNLYKNGGVLITNEHQRLFAEAKTTNYLQAVALQKQKKKAKAIEVLYVHQDAVLEAATSNIFFVQGKNIVTPKENILKGITRNAVIDLAKRAGYIVVERNISVKELLAADEVFLTATNKKVLPIVMIDGKKIGDGAVGVVSKELNELFAAYIQKQCAYMFKKS